MKKTCLFLISAIWLLSASAQDSMNIKLLFHWEDTALVASSGHDNTYNEIWGYARNGREYAIIGTTAGTHIFDITDLSTATEVAFIPGAIQGTAIVHRDFHDYQNYLYIVCDEGASTLQIADLSYLPDSAPLVYDSDSLFSRSHNIFIDTVTAKMYVCGGSSPQCFQCHLNVYSLADPLMPDLIINCKNDLAWWSGDIGYVHDIYVKNDTAWCNAGNDGLFIVDFTDTFNPQQIGSLTSYPDKGYNHSGWLHPSGNTYAIADETHGMRVKITDVSDFGNMSVISLVASGIDTNSIPHNLIYKEDYLFVSYYHDGLYIFNTSDPANPFITGYYDTSEEPNTTNYRGAWGVYPFLPSGKILVSDMQEGLFVFDASEATPVETVKAHPELNVFPNPFTDEIVISAAGALNYEISDITGRVVDSGTTVNGRIIPKEKHPEGVYFLKVYKNNNSIIKKLIKIRKH